MVFVLMLRFICLCGFLLVLCTAAVAGNAPTWTAIDIQTNGAPRGYWEYLPTAYHLDPSEKRPVVVFFHGLGEGGNGTTDLPEVLQNGPPAIANNSNHPLHSIFNDNDAILLAPQITNNTWWNHIHIRDYLNFVLSFYPVDERRLYLTGLSAGSSGIHSFMDEQPLAQQVAAVTTSALRGRVDAGEGDYLAAIMPYWALTARGDAFSSASNTVNALAAFHAQSTPDDLLTDYPGQDQNYTGMFDPAMGWQWSAGYDASAGFNPRITIYPGSAHTTWVQTYDSLTVWNWLFSQIKPELDLQAPIDGAVFEQSASIAFLASATDMDAMPINNIQWSSSVDGTLGVGTSINPVLSVGIHEIEVLAIDAHFRGRLKSVQIEVIPPQSDMIFVDGFDVN